MADSGCHRARTCSGITTPHEVASSADVGIDSIHDMATAKETTMNDYPWIGVGRWRNGAIKTNLAAPFFILLGFSVLLIATSMPILVSEWPRLSEDIQAWVITEPSTFQPEFLLFALPVVWLLTLKPLYRLGWRWRRFREVSITLDPYPGSVGGQVGGYASVPVRWESRMPVDIRLNCDRVSVSGGGKNRSRSEKVLWRRRAVARATPSGAEGTRIEFLVDVDGGLPSSDAKKGSSHTYWTVRIQLVGSGYDQSFDIPVFDTGRRQESKLRLPDGDLASRIKAVGDVAKTVADVRETGQGFAIDFPPGRSGSMGSILAVIGLCLGAVAGFMWYQAHLEFAGQNTRYFELLVSSMIAFGFSLFAVPLFFGGVFMRINRLLLVLDGDWLMVERRAFGKRFRKRISAEDIHDIDKKVTTQSGRGAAAKIYYTIKLETRQGKRISIADGIPGQEDADALLNFLRGKIKLHPENADRAMGKMHPPRWVGYFVVVAKIFSALIILATVAAFFTDFFLAS